MIFEWPTTNLGMICNYYPKKIQKNPNFFQGVGFMVYKRTDILYDVYLSVGQDA
jgi:hypothetical protein